MRYLIDTNIFIYLSTDREGLHPDVLAMLSEPETLLYISTESVRELIVAYNSKGLGNKKWKTAEDMVRSTKNNGIKSSYPHHSQADFSPASQTISPLLKR